MSRQVGGDQVGGDQVGGDQVGGDQVGGDQVGGDQVGGDFGQWPNSVSVCVVVGCGGGVWWCDVRSLK